MIVSELIEQLSKYDPKFKVVVSWNHGDYGLEPIMEVDSIEVESENKIKNNFIFNGKTIADFRQVSDRFVYIEFDDGTEVTIEAKINYNAYDEEWGKYEEEAFLDIKVD